jgi:hypothetical protein
MATAKTNRARRRPARREPTPAMTVEKLQGMSQRELDNLYRQSVPGAIPSGVGDGTVVVAGAGPISPLASAVARLGWRGKVFDTNRGSLVNRILPFGLRAVRANVLHGTSLLDGKPTIVLDYSRTSLLARYIRDEIREVAPKLYLGIVYWGGRKTINFVLSFGE